MQKKIGVVGGGQLGRMLQEEALRYGQNLHFLDNDTKAPCSIFSNFQKGDIKDYNAVYNFGKNLNALTIEIEHINTEALEALEKEGKEVYPYPSILNIIKDKSLQKQFYKDNNIPTSDFVIVDGNTIEESVAHIWYPFVQKAKTDGYDGKGVAVINDKTQLDKQLGVPSLLEKKVAINKELCITLAIDRNLNNLLYPIGEMVFDDNLNLLDYIIAPADIDTNIANQVIAITEKLGKALNSPGVYSIEFFLSQEGDVLVNEIAPRAHNSAHYTIEGCNMSQYEAQFRLLNEIPFVAKIETYKRYSATLNLIGEKGFTGSPIIEGTDILGKYDDVFIHIYGKEVTKPGRKMGHITLLDDDKSKLIETIQEIKKTIKITGTNKL